MIEPKIRFKADDGSSFPDWKICELEKLSEFITKGATPTTYGYQWQKEGIPFFRNDAIKENKFVYGDFSYISEEAHQSLNRSEIMAYDIVIAITGDIGKVGMIPNKIVKGNINQHMARIRIIKAIPYYIYQYLCTSIVQNEYQKIKTGLSMPQLSLEQVRNTKIALPSITEQQKIADFLSNVDEVIAASEEEVANLEKQKKGMMQKIFSQEVRFKKEDGSDFPDWEEKRFDELYKSFPNKNYQIQTVDYNNIGKYVVIDQGKEYIAGYSDNEEKVCVRYPCIVFGDHTTIVKYVDEPFVVGADGVKTLSATILAKYAYYLLDYNNVIPTGYNRHFSHLKELIMDTSVDEEEQQLIADFLTSYDEAITAAKQELAKWKELKKGLLQQMFV